MAIVKEITSDIIKKTGETVSAGQSTRSRARTGTYTAQFPAARAAGNDTTGDFQVSDLYKNGLLFTAYDLTSRDSSTLRSMRSSASSSQLVDIFSKNTPSGMKKTPLVNMLLPRSKSDVDSTSHRFNDVGDSLITRGGGTATGVLSNMASSAVFGALESITQGIMADNNEQIYNSSRSMYGGAENRTKVFTWDLTPRTPQDLIEIINIYEYFNYFSYGETGTSQYAKEVKSGLDDWYKSTILNTLSPEDASKNNTLFEKMTSALSNVLVVANPTIWIVRNFGKTSKFDGKTDVFGPCQIQSIRFDKTPNGQYNGLAIAPNLPSTFTLEVTMREIVALNRGSLYSEGF